MRPRRVGSRMRVMNAREHRLPRPLYEALPWIYVAAGLGALAISYMVTGSVLSTLVGLLGLAALLAGIVIVLRRRDYREMRTHYERPDALAEQGKELD